MKKIVLTVIALIFFGNAQAVKITVHKTFLSHTPGNDWAYANRTTEDVEGPFGEVVERIVRIFCEGNGAETCPNRIAVPVGGSEPADYPPLNDYLPVAAINGAQSLLDNAVSLYNSGQMNGYQSGTLVIPTGEYYSYVISWETDINTEETNLIMTFNPSPTPVTPSN